MIAPAIFNILDRNVFSLDWDVIYLFKPKLLFTFAVVIITRDNILKVILSFKKTFYLWYVTRN